MRKHDKKNTKKNKQKKCFLVFPHFEKLDSNAGKHKIQKHGDQYDISNGLHSNKHTLDNMLERQRDDVKFG